MTETTLPEDLLALLRKVDTPTVCNAIDVWITFGQWRPGLAQALLLWKT